VGNLVLGDDAGLSGTGTMAAANAGAQVLASTGGALSGLSVSNSNYTVTGASGTVTVTPADITVTALGGTSVYGASPSNPGLSASGLQNGESVGVLSGLTNSFGITGTSGVGSSPYTLTVTGTLDNANYNITARNSGSWTVTPADITVTTQSASTVANGVFNSTPWFMESIMTAFGAETAFGAGAGMTIFGGGIFSTEFSGTGNSGTSLFYSDIRFGP
jgi:hypothetical protein